MIHELKERIRLLSGSESIKGIMEERLLLWLGSETIDNSESNERLLNNLLERVLELLNLHSAFCYELKANQPVLIDASYSKVESLGEFNFKPSENLQSQLKNGPVFLSKADLLENSQGISHKLMQHVGSMGLIPFQSLTLPFGVFIFIDFQSKEIPLLKYKLSLQYLVNKAIEKFEKESLLDELKKLNHTFEEKLEQRTKKYISNIEKLKKEIKERLPIEISNPDKKNEPATQLGISDVSLLRDIGVEIRTPLNGIRGFAEILRDENIPSHERNNYIDIIKSCTNSLLQIVDDSVSFVKISQEKPAPKLKALKLTPFFTKLYDNFKNDELFRQRDNVDLRLNLNIPANKEIEIDQEMLDQLLSNLISNAIKFTIEGYIEFGGSIETNDSNEHEERLVLFVKDTGVGISSEIGDEVFEPFFKLEHEMSTLYSGMGLGLSIAKEISLLLGGDLWFESKLHKGTTFFFSLPIKVEKDGLNEISHISDNDKKYDWEGRRFLIVEDDPMSVHFLKEVIRPTKAKVLVASDGKEGVNLFTQDSDFDLVLMDIKLPGINGYETTREIKKVKHVPVIAQTAYAMADDMNKSLQAGCDAYVSKPINRIKLLHLMNELMIAYAAG